MSPKRTPETPRDIIRRLEADGWIARQGKGDHRNFTKPGVRAVVTVDTGAREIPVGTLRSIYRAAGWDW